VIVGIKKLKGQAEPNKQAHDSGLDYGIEFVPEPEVTSDPDPEYTEKLEADLREKNKQYTELQIEHEKLKEEFEALQEKNEKYREMKNYKYNDLKKSYKDLDARYWKKYYETLNFNDTISDILTEEQRDEVRKLLQGKEKYQSKVEDERKKPKPVKSVLSIIDDSDDEDEGPTIRIKDNKIMKAIECECDFLD
jgi:predicted  nucleic acid-binding Zn-ribbon protein